MLKIKLSRDGKNNQPSYRVVVAEAKSKLNGKYVQLIGHYNPLTQPKIVNIDKKAYEDWLKKGAKPTKTVERLYKNLT